MTPSLPSPPPSAPPHLTARRYWAVRGLGDASRDAGSERRGFLWVPSIDLLSFAGEIRVHTLDALRAVPCLLLLGDPALGKTTELDTYARRLVAAGASDVAVNGAARGGGAATAPSLVAAPAAARAANGPATGGAALVPPATPGDVILRYPAREFESRADLRDRLFGGAAVARWREGSGTLHLLLDGLDESAMALDAFCAALLEGLADLPVVRLRLRLVCRTAVVPPDLVRQLGEVFRSSPPTPDGAGPGEARGPTGVEDAVVADGLSDADTTGGGLSDAEADEEANGAPRIDLEARGVRAMVGGRQPGLPSESVVAIELQPLRAEDAAAAAEAALGDPGAGPAFLQAVADANVEAFAARPVTLRALVARFRAGRGLGGSQAALYHELCAELAGRVAPRRDALGRERRRFTTQAQRLRLAGRLSAALLFGNRRAVWRGDGPPPTSDLLDVGDCAGVERVDGVDVACEGWTVAEALDTALFTGASDGGAETLALAAHQVYAEFLAADWVAARDLRLPQVLALLREPEDPAGRVVPQLRQVASWLAALRRDVADALLAAEPEAAFWSDAAELPMDRRAAAAAALLDRATAHRLEEPDFGFGGALARLDHPGLADQLGTAVADAALPTRTRVLALQIGRETGCAPVGPAAAALALDPAAALDLRVEAGRLVAALGGDAERGAIAPLATDALGDDDREQLKGVALAACWRQLAPDVLFACLTPPRRPNYHGAYAEARRRVGEELLAAFAGPVLSAAGSAAGPSTSVRRRARADGGPVGPLVGGDGPAYAAAAARWLDAMGSRAALVEPIDEAAFLVAFAYVTDPTVGRPLGAYVRQRLARYRPLVENLGSRAAKRVGEALAANAGARRALLVATLDGVHAVVTEGDDGEAEEGMAGSATSSRATALAARVPVSTWAVAVADAPDLLPDSDVTWALVHLTRLPATDARREPWRTALRWRFRPTDAEHLAAAFAHRADPDIRGLLGDAVAGAPSLEDAAAFVAAAVATQEAEWQRRRAEAEARKAERDRTRVRQAERVVPIRERIALALADADTAGGSGGGDADGAGAGAGRGVGVAAAAVWTRVVDSLCRGLDGVRHRWEPDPQLVVELPRVLGTSLAARVIDAAAAFLAYTLPATPAYPDDGRVLEPSRLGWAAAHVLGVLAPGRLDDIPATTWARWLPTFVGHRPLGANGHAREVAAHTVVLVAGSRAAPDSLDAALLAAFDAWAQAAAAEEAAAAGAPSAPRVGRTALWPADAVVALAAERASVAAALARRAADRAYPPEAGAAVLRTLLAHGGASRAAARAAVDRLMSLEPMGAALDPAPGARAGADGRMETVGSGIAGARARAAGVMAAGAGLVADLQGMWPVIGPRLVPDLVLAREALLAGAGQRQHGSAGEFDETDPAILGAFARLLVATFPTVDDPWHSFAYSPDRLDYAVDWRGAVVRALTERRTPEAARALAELAADLPTEEWLHHAWRRAESALAEDRWRGTPPRTVIALAGHPDVRVVESDGQLLDLLAESLARLEREWQGEWRGVVSLWDEQRIVAVGRARRTRTEGAPPQGGAAGAARVPVPLDDRFPPAAPSVPDTPASGQWLPKHEAHLANEIARHLRRDLAGRGLVIGRELVVQVGIRGGAEGLRTDLDVRAPTVDGPDAGNGIGAEPRAIIEVKGSWNVEVPRAMEAQLVRDYLDPHGVRAGLYVVGWYSCAAWAPTSARSRSDALGPLSVLRATLSAQAAGLTTSLRDVRAVVLDAALPDQSGPGTTSGLG